MIISRFNVSFMYAIHSIKNEFAFLNIQGTVWFANFGSFEIIFYSASGSFAFKSVALIVEDHHISPSQVNNTRVFFFFFHRHNPLYRIVLIYFLSWIAYGQPWQFWWFWLYLMHTCIFCILLVASKGIICIVLFIEIIGSFGFCSSLNHRLHLASSITKHCLIQHLTILT